MSTPARAVLSRRTLVTQLAFAAAGLAAGGCTTAGLLLNPTPTPDRRDRGITEPTLRLLVDTVVPGTPIDRPGAADLFFDQAYPLARYRGVLAGDLQDRAQLLAGAPFDALPRHTRQAIVRDGLERGGTTARLYAGAVFLAQVAVFSGIVHQDGSCPPIGFAGPGGLLAPPMQTYDSPARFLGAARTLDGNPN